MHCRRTNRSNLPSWAIARPVVGETQESILDDHGNLLRLGQREAVSPALG
jgi:hypothetical protein